MTDLNKTASTLLLKQLKGLKPSFTRNSIPDFSSTFPRDAYPTSPPPLAEVALLHDQRSWPVPGAPAPLSTEERSALKSALAQQKLILPNRKENRTTASPVTAAQQEWYGLSWTGVIAKDTSCSHRPKRRSLCLVSGASCLTHLSPGLTAGGQRAVLLRQHSNRSFHSVWVIAREAEDIRWLKSQKNNVSRQRKF